MKAVMIMMLVSLVIGTPSTYAQSSPGNGKALNFPGRKYGISIGNSHEFNGLRINFADHEVKQINGVNITLWIRLFKNTDAVVNGISLGVLPTAGTMRGFNCGILGTGASGNISGLNIGGLVVGSGGKQQGISISGLMTGADGENGTLNGIALSGILTMSEKAINGFSFGGLAVGSNGCIRGVSSSVGCILAEEGFYGLALTAGYFYSQKLHGMCIAAYSNTGISKGLSLALINRSKELHGVQIGLLNIASNNPRGLRVLPIINMHLG